MIVHSAAALHLALIAGKLTSLLGQIAVRQCVLAHPFLSPIINLATHPGRVRKEIVHLPVVILIHIYLVLRIATPKIQEMTVYALKHTPPWPDRLT